jgi:LPXTG-site transpeptidase (sortase) family protein
VSPGSAPSARAGRSPSGVAARAAGAAAALAVLVLLGCGGDPAPEHAPAAEPAARAERSAQDEPRDRDGTVRGEAAERGPTASQTAARAAERELPLSRADKEAADPRRIEVPAIGVSARVIELGLNADRTLEVPKRYEQTGWWKGGPEPGERGAAVIAGHVDSKTGPAVFHRLEQLRAGDQIRVHRADGTQARFVVRRLERHPKDDFPTGKVYGRTDKPTLRLVTCSGDFDASTGHYVDNTIVFADAA